MSTYHWDHMPDVGVMWLAEKSVLGAVIRDIALIRYDKAKPDRTTYAVGCPLNSQVEVKAPPGMTIDELKAYVATLARMEN